MQTQPFATRAEQRPFSATARFSHRWTDRVGSCALAALGVFIGLCLLTYQLEDLGFLSSEVQRPTANWGGLVGAWIGFIGRGGFGWASMLGPVLCGLWAWQLWRGRVREIHGISITVASICLVSSAAVLLALQSASADLQVDLGGLCGLLLASSGREYLGFAGIVLASLGISILSSLVIVTQIGFLPWPVSASPQPGHSVGRRNGAALKHRGISVDDESAAVTEAKKDLAEPEKAKGEGWVRKTIGGRLSGIIRRKSASKDEERAGELVGSDVESADLSLKERPGIAQEQNNASALRVRSGSISPSKVALELTKRQNPQGYQFPSISLLANPPLFTQLQSTEDLQLNARILEETLREFGVQASVVNVDRGPTVTRYELTPAPGVKLTRIVSLADDLALVMKAASCHIVAPIPGKGRVGVDVPNHTSTTVYLKELMICSAFTSHPSPLILPIGKDVSGEPVMTDLRECPHLLIAGATGSGKTVCLNSVLLGILMHTTPQQVNFLMIDPKMVELVMFNDIPHLVAPVVTNAKKASVALHWAVQEMERRYRLLADASVRNIAQYNTWIASQPPSRMQPPAESPQDTEDKQDDSPQHQGSLAYLVIVIDELADLMMVASQDVEGAITRLAQLSRAVGIHMIIATQRPSVDVITGVIKANFPARIAFQVASKVDSRTILDINGADKLLGRGDLLFLRPGTAKPIRAQGAFVTDKEIEQVTLFLKQQQSPLYDEQLMDSQRHPEQAVGGISEKDELYEIAKQVVLETGQASTSLLQRRLRLGYGRAARILDIMEQEGLVGPPQGSRPREILVKSGLLQK